MPSIEMTPSKSILWISLGLCCLSFAMGINTSQWTKEDLIRSDVTEDSETELDPSDFERAEETRDLDLSLLLPRSGNGDPTLSSGKIEGDIAGFKDKAELGEFVKNSNDFRRNAIRSSWRRWPNGKIPYTLSARYGTYSRRTIAKAMQEYHDKTCIEFIPRDPTKHRDYIYIHPDDGCYSLVGRTGGKQPLSLDAGCIQTGTVIHELMHTVGFFHEQSRNDRDEWIDIAYANVLSEAQDQFEKYSLRTISHLGQPYDYSSIMHYGPYAFTRNGRKTIKAKKRGGYNMGQRDGFSQIDLIKINKLYKCKGDSSSTLTTTTRRPSVRLTTKRPRPRPSTRKPTTTIKECKDNSWRCAFWTLGVIDYCSKYKSVRNDFCPKSCGTCKKGGGSTVITTTRRPTTTTTTKRPAKKSNCRDKNPACSRWAGKNYCIKKGYSGFMRKTCKKSCEVCTSSDHGGRNLKKNVVEGEGGESPCKDTPSYQCRLSKLLGACSNRKHTKRMEENCPKTCGFC